MAIRAELDRFRPNLIHLATPFNLGLCGLRYAQSHQLPFVTSYHTHFDRYLDYYRMKAIVPLYWSYIKWFHRSCEATFAPSHDTIHTLQSQGIERLKLWSRGVDCQLFTPEKRNLSIRERYAIQEPLILLYVGRIAPEKDMDTLSTIMRTLPQSLQQRVHWLIVGDGPLLPELREQVPSNVTFTGYMHGEELAQLYASADMFVFPSTTETFGNVVLEAMASGLPVIGANAGGVREIVVPGSTGVLCEPGIPGSFIREISRYADHPEQLSLLSNEARRVALTRSWDSVFDELINNYARIIDSHHNQSKIHSA
ncbi:GDP-mannose-dependent alpha-mannosyltransferase [compost metagenome]